MPQGIQVFNEQGAVTLDITDGFSKFVQSGRMPWPTVSQTIYINGFKDDGSWLVLVSHGGYARYFNGYFTLLRSTVFGGGVSGDLSTGTNYSVWSK